MTQSAGCRDSARPRLSGGQQILAMLVVRLQIHLSRANGQAEFRALATYIASATYVAVSVRVSGSVVGVHPGVYDHVPACV